jgi:hypothetical protein
MLPKSVPFTPLKNTTYPYRKNENLSQLPKAIYSPSSVPKILLHLMSRVPLSATKKTGSKMARVTLWHVSPASNADSIFTKGIIPCYGQTESQLKARKTVKSWYVRWYGLMWAILHISYQKHIPVWKLAVFKINVDRKHLTHFRGQIYTTARVIKPRFMMSAEYAFNRIEVQRQYASNQISRRHKHASGILDNDSSGNGVSF